MLNVSFADAYGSLTVNIFLSSNSHSGMVISSVFFLKLWAASFAKFDGKPAF